MFTSRSNYNKESFLNVFFETLTPWLIKRDEFINWDRILTALRQKQPYINDLSNYDFLNRDILESQIKDTILSLDNPYEFLQDLFILLWNTRDFFVSDIDNIILKKYSKDIVDWDLQKASQIAKCVVEVWFSKILERENISDYFVWLLVGFESDKRKNKWWTEFVNLVRPTLELIVSHFEELELLEEAVIEYEWEDTTQNKKVDFAIFENGNCIIWIEVNFYTNSWSKPTEIKRSYWEVNRKLKNVWVELMWVTDGFGYNKMKKSLWDAFEIHPNTYNFNMLKSNFEDDLRYYLNNR